MSEKDELEGEGEESHGLPKAQVQPTMDSKEISNSILTQKFEIWNEGKKIMFYSSIPHAMEEKLFPFHDMAQWASFHVIRCHNNDNDKIEYALTCHKPNQLQNRRGISLRGHTT